MSCQDNYIVITRYEEGMLPNPYWRSSSPPPSLAWFYGWANRNQELGRNAKGPVWENSSGLWQTGGMCKGCHTRCQLDMVSRELLELNLHLAQDLSANDWDPTEIQLRWLNTSLTKKKKPGTAGSFSSFMRPNICHSTQQQDCHQLEKGPAGRSLLGPEQGSKLCCGS